MEDREIETIEFIDLGSGAPAVAIVRQCEGNVGLTLSIQRNGDLEVMLDTASAQKLADAINERIEMIARTSR